ncbi:MAG: polysaccharide deacetylase family protein [Armatimonadetes bacterium]|nr:polysaccharide deacetylase family protein [Armatimonadota bacterium]
MSPRKGHAGRSASRFAGMLWFVVVVVLFAGSAFLLTCQRNPGGISRGHFAAPESHPTRTTHERASQPEHTARETAPPVTQEMTSETPPGEPQRHVPLGPYTMSSGRFGEVGRGNPESRKIALTFDAGADSAPASEILDTLAKYKLHATFFLTGKWVEKNPELTRRIAAEGHEIGNHTYSHRRLTEMSPEEMADEVEKTDQLVVKLTGRSTKPLLRVPMGSRDDQVLETLRNLGYRSIYWDIDSWDAVGRKHMTSAGIEERVLGMMRNGSIVLMHCGSKPTADALDSMLQKLIAEGYQQVKVSELPGNG